MPIRDLPGLRFGLLGANMSRTTQSISRTSN